MYQLLLDSSNKFLSVGLAKDGKVVDKICYEAWQRQSEMMVTEVGNILKRNNIKNKDLDGVVVGIGPGSYTGVRIGVTIAKTIAYALKIKVYAKSSLSLLKHPEFPTICVFNARSGRSYFAVYEGKKVIEKDTVLENDRVLDYIKAHPDYLIHGDTYQLGLESGKFDIIDNLADFDKNEEVDVFRLNPVYLKDLLL
ncbi:MAG: tRNA (adenosine(37)-N6)-threonylcarbamoyltransferase complex dimerization subunit type 1 TsaB [Bacilli bacterium]|nr:tRNA (adenosine(37)-N6)-threonylcarbamoyltransferase complex dimerization subunit type 1 TsaB [Bacilli bacterium]